jgi:hypothetical protein
LRIILETLLFLSREAPEFLFLKKTLLFLSTVEEVLSPCHGMRERRQSVVKARKKREEGGGFGVLGLIVGQETFLSFGL